MGTHELDECLYLKIVCEGCGKKINKSDQIRHETLDCTNPVWLKDLQKNKRDGNQRDMVKMEYFDSQDFDDHILQDEPSFEEQLKKSSKTLGRKKSI